jgi:LmbE family N-acetylglucosaminyl deacetylase
MPPLDPTSVANGMDNISGAFEIEVVARFDDLGGGYWQRVFDIGDGPNSNNLILSQYENTSDMMFVLYQDGTAYRVTAPEAIVQGETATWNVGIDPDGLMWIDKNGMRLAEDQAAVPADVVRVNELLGQSNWTEDTPLDGAVLGIDVTNDGAANDTDLLNNPVQIDGAFQLESIVRFDDLSRGEDQRVFDFGSDGTDSILLTQVTGTNDLRFEIQQDGQVFSVTAPDAIVEGEWALWSVGADADGLMWLEKDGARLVETLGVVPNDVDRADLYIGSSSASGNDALDGVVLDLTISQTSGVTDPVDPSVPVDPVDPVGPVDPVDPVGPVGPVVPVDPDPANGPQQINGAFQIEMTVRFDDIQGGYWQRVFDFGDGPASNNILFTQVENTNDIMLELWQDGTSYRVIAEGAITQGEDASWSVGIDGTGRMWIEKDGALLAEGQGAVPADVDRANLLVGESNWPDDTPLIGQIGTLSVVEPVADPVDPVGPVGPVDPVDPVVPVDPVDPVGPVDPVVPVDPISPVDPVIGNGDMILVAHQDDDLLFMNPTINALIDGDAPVTSVYLTAGDAGLDEAYWGDRELGMKAAYGAMANASDWVDETVSVEVGGSQFDIASSYLASEPDIRLYFLRLPDGFSDGTGSEQYGNQSLEQLWEGQIGSITSVDGANSYTQMELTGVLTSLMDLQQPDQFRILDNTSPNADIEHSDHLHATEFATVALQDYNADFTVTSYVGYASWGLEENLTPTDTEDVRDFFLDYAAFDPQVLDGGGGLQEAYVEWVQREYVANEYSETADAPAAMALQGAGLIEALMLPEGLATFEEPATGIADAGDVAADEFII